MKLTQENVVDLTDLLAMERSKKAKKGPVSATGPFKVLQKIKPEGSIIALVCKLNDRIYLPKYHRHYQDNLGIDYFPKW